MCPAIDTAIAPCTQVRSTLLVGSLHALRVRGHGEAYVARAGAELAAKIAAPGAPQWLPIELAEAHYGACDAMRLSVDEMLKIGGVVAPTAASGVQILLRAARTTGVNVWTALDRTPTYWRRMYEGSAIEVIKTGPKDATLIVRRNSLARYVYWRVGLRGIIGELARALAVKAIAREDATRSLAHDSVTYSLSWV